MWDVGLHSLALPWDSEYHGSSFPIPDVTEACLSPALALCSLLPLPPSPLLPSVSSASRSYLRYSLDPLSDLVTTAVVAVAPVATLPALTILYISTSAPCQNGAPEANQETPIDRLILPCGRSLSHPKVTAAASEPGRRGQECLLWPGQHFIQMNNCVLLQSWTFLWAARGRLSSPARMQTVPRLHQLLR